QPASLERSAAAPCTCADTLQLHYALQRTVRKQWNRAGDRLLQPQVGSPRLVSKKTHLSGARVRATKSPQQHPARAGWRKFGEYAFLEDSRYASQQENKRRKRLTDLATAATRRRCGAASAQALDGDEFVAGGGAVGRRHRAGDLLAL